MELGGIIWLSGVVNVDGIVKGFLVLLLLRMSDMRLNQMY